LWPSNGFVREAGRAHGDRVEGVAAIDDKRVPHYSSDVREYQLPQFRPFRDDHGSV